MYVSPNVLASRVVKIGNDCKCGLSCVCLSVFILCLSFYLYVCVCFCFSMLGCLSSFLCSSLYLSLSVSLPPSASPSLYGVSLAGAGGLPLMQDYRLNIGRRMFRLRDGFKTNWHPVYRRWPNLLIAPQRPLVHITHTVIAMSKERRWRLIYT